jgi:predicted TIM-barrel fold metal-dependent hydrolase
MTIKAAHSLSFEALSTVPLPDRGSRSAPLATADSLYIRRNIAVTTSGMCSDDSLRCSLDAMGVENVMFSIDYPFEKTEIATRFIETAKVTEAERFQVASANATRILHLDHHRSASHQGV